MAKSTEHKDDKDKEEKPPIEEAPPAILAPDGAIAGRTPKLISAKAANKRATIVNKDMDTSQVRSIIMSIATASDDGEYSLAVDSIPIALRKELEAKGYKIEDKGGHKLISWGKEE